MKPKLCPCNSGKLFRNCCLRDALSFPVNLTNEVPLQFPFYLEVCIDVSDWDLQNPTPFWPVFIVGRNKTSVFDKARPEIGSDEILRVGFCNNEYRPFVQVRTNRGLFELRGNDVLRKSVNYLTVAFGEFPQSIQLFVNDKLCQTSTLEGELIHCLYEELAIGRSDGLIMEYCHVVRGRFDPARKHVHPTPSPDFSSWLQYPDYVAKILKPTESRDYVYSCFSRMLIERTRSKQPLAQRIVNVITMSEGANCSPEEAVVVAAKRLTQLTDELEAIVNSANTSEPDLLSFFKQNPAAGFLLDPGLHVQWREQAIQQYGRIDFVFERVDTTFNVVEIESHTKKLFTKTDELCQPVYHAKEQVRTWIRGIGKNATIASRQYGLHDIEAYRGMVVIGRSEEINNTPRRERWLAEKHPINTLTWDDVISRGRLLADRLGDPALSRYEWKETE